MCGTKNHIACRMRQAGQRLYHGDFVAIYQCSDNYIIRILTTVILGLSGFELPNDFIRFRRRFELSEDGCFSPDVI